MTIIKIVFIFYSIPKTTIAAIDTVDLESVVSIITAFLFIQLSIFLFSYKKGNRLSNRILSVFFFLNFIYAILYYLIHIGFWFEYPPLYLTSNSLFYFMGPLLYFYTKSLCYKDFRVEKKAIIHFLPFLFLVVFVFLYYHLKIAFVPRPNSSNVIPLSRYEILVYFCLLYGFLLDYCFLSLNTLSRYRKDLKNHYSNVNRINLAWLSMIIIAYTCMFFLDLIIYLLLFIPGFPSLILTILNQSSGAINLAFALVILFKGLKQSDILTGISSEKYKTARLPTHEIDEYKNRIETAMAGQKPYLDPELSLDNLAEILSIPARHLSQVINVAFNQNFFDFISDYRIHEAKQMLNDPAYKDSTILNILFDVGFNSKSSFNHLFKKKTGMTPSEFRKKSLDQIENV